MSSTENIRNFCIIAHVDHGKTTLSDRILELTQTVEHRNMQDQLLDSMDLERERGITIKSHPVSMVFTHDTSEYAFNLIDTPGHVDFSYEVSRSLAACEGALLLIDAAQGIEAQTVANAHLATEQGLEIIPVINKIDLPSADIPAIQAQLEDVLAIPAEEAILTSAKTGVGIPELMQSIVKKVPCPRWVDAEGLRMLIFDCIYDTYKGVICYVRVFSGTVKANEGIAMMSDGTKALTKEVGKFSPAMQAQQELRAGDVGYIVTNIRDVSEIKLGDTITLQNNPAKEMLPGFKEVSPMVFSGIYPIDTSDYNKLKASMGKLRLNDAAFVYQSENSVALGFGFRCGFLGLLHLEIIQERLSREFNLNLITTSPSVVYKVEKTNDTKVAKLLSDGDVVARYGKGGMEFGARALGNRSILADPRRPDVIHHINKLVKMRDFWMPFAPSIIKEREDDYIINPKGIDGRFMAVGFDTTDLAKDHIAAGIHPFDKTARPQIVHKEDNPEYHSLIQEFEKITGVGALMNTSFNIHGESIVGTPHDAIDTFLRCGLDHLFIGSWLISKTKN